MFRISLFFTLSVAATMLSAQGTYDTFTHADVVKKAKCSACHQSDQDSLAAISAAYLSDVSSVSAYMESHPALIGLRYDLRYAYAAGGSVSMQMKGFLVECCVDPILRSHLRLEEKGGVIVKHVDGQADSDGPSLVQVGDVMLTVNDQSIMTPQQLRELADDDPSAQWTIDLVRAGHRHEVMLSADAFASPPKEYRLGVQAEPVGEALSLQLGLQGRGLLITEVVEKSAAALAGIKKYDILIEAGEIDVSSIDDLRAANRSSGGDEMDLRLIREGKLTKVAVQPKEVEQSPYRIDQYCPGIPSK
ncbi:MAG: PDZ domain-containing protein [Planctomycetota bacterium]